MRNYGITVHVTSELIDNEDAREQTKDAAVKSWARNARKDGYEPVASPTATLHGPDPMNPRFPYTWAVKGPVSFR